MPPAFPPKKLFRVRKTDKKNLTTKIWITFTSTPWWKNSANGEWAGKGSERQTTFSWEYTQQISKLRSCTHGILPGGSGSGLREKKKSNQNGFSRKRKNKATRCVISGMSFAHRPLDDASQRWPVEVMVADARWSVSLTLPNRDSIYRSKCYTFLCHSDINLTLLHRAGNSFHPRATERTKCFRCVIPFHRPAALGARYR